MKAPKSRTNSKRGVHDLGIFGTGSDYVDQDALSCFSLLNAKRGGPQHPATHIKLKTKHQGLQKVNPYNQTANNTISVLIFNEDFQCFPFSTLPLQNSRGPPAATLDDLRSVPKTHMATFRISFCELSSTSTYTHPHTQIAKNKMLRMDG